MVKRMKGTYRLAQNLKGRTVYITEEPVIDKPSTEDPNKEVRSTEVINQDKASEFPLIPVLIASCVAILILGGIIAFYLRKGKEGLIDSTEGTNQ